MKHIRAGLIVGLVVFGVGMAAYAGAWLLSHVIGWPAAALIVSVSVIFGAASAIADFVTTEEE